MHYALFALAVVAFLMATAGLALQSLYELDLPGRLRHSRTAIVLFVVPPCAWVIGGLICLAFSYGID